MKELIKCRNFQKQRRIIYLKLFINEIAIFAIALLWFTFDSDWDFMHQFLLCLFVGIFPPFFIMRIRTSQWTIPTEVEIDDDVIYVRAECLWRDRTCIFERQVGVYIGDRGHEIYISKKSSDRHTFFFCRFTCWPEEAVEELRNALLKHGWTLEEKYI